MAATWGLALLAVAAWPSSGLGSAPVDDVLGGLLAWLAVGLAAWLATSSALSVLALLPGVVGEAIGAVMAAVTPHVVRRAISLGMGATMGAVALPAPAAIATSAGLGASTASQADAPAPAFVPTPERAAAPPPVTPPTVALGPSADTQTSAAAGASGALRVTAPAASRTESAAPTTRDEPPGPGWTPDRPTRFASPEEAQLLRPALRPSATAVETITVRRGDTLWSIAARQLGPRASESEIAAEWPRWYAANRAVLGDDPDLIRPGQQLVVPATESAR